MSPRVAYFITVYPKVSHSFIRREIRALERQGIQVQRIAMRGWDGELVDREDIAERAVTRYVLRDGLAALVLATLRLVLSSPIRFFSALGLAIRMARGSE